MGQGHVSLPKPEEYKFGITLATGAYCWWPCSPALGLAGLATLRGRAQRIGFIFFFGSCPSSLLHAVPSSVARLRDWGTARATSFRCRPDGRRLRRRARAPLAARERSRPAPAPSRPRGPLRSPSSRCCALSCASSRSSSPRSPTTRPLRLNEPSPSPPAPRHRVRKRRDHRHRPRPARELPLELYPDQDVLIAVDRSPDEAARACDTPCRGRPTGVRLRPRSASSRSRTKSLLPMPSSPRTSLQRWAFAAVPAVGLLELGAHLVQTHSLVA